MTIRTTRVYRKLRSQSMRTRQSWHSIYRRYTETYDSVLLNSPHRWYEILIHELKSFIKYKILSNYAFYGRRHFTAYIPKKLSLLRTMYTYRITCWQVLNSLQLTETYLVLVFLNITLCLRLGQIIHEYRRTFWNWYEYNIRLEVK